jgi:MRG-binding protein
MKSDFRSALDQTVQSEMNIKNRNIPQQTPMTTNNRPGPTIDVPQPPWTYDLEITLFKAIVTYRPIGIHRSLRLVTILNAVNSQIPSSDTPLTLQDIKSKLNELYNMEGLEEQEESEDTTEEDLKPTQTEFEFPFQEVVGIIEDRGRGVEGDCSGPNSPEAVRSVRSGGSGRGRGTKRRREESTGISITDAGTDEDGTNLYTDDETDGTVTSPTELTRTKRPRNTATQRKVSASATPAASTAPKRGRARRAKKKEEKEESSEEEADEEEAEEEGAEEEEVGDTESVAETTSVTGTDAPAKGLRTSSRRKGAADDSQAAARGKAARARGAAVRGGRSRARARGARTR